MSTSEDAKRLVREARHGSVTAIHKISTSARIIRNHTSQLLPLILQHISEPIPGSECSQLSATRLSLQHYSLDILRVLLASDTLATSRSRTQIIRFYEAHWPAICAWVAYFLDRVVLEDTHWHTLDDVTDPTSLDHSFDDLELRDTIWHSLISLLLNVTEVPQHGTTYLALMASSTTLVSVLLRLWIAAAESNHDTLLDTTALVAQIYPHAVEEDVWEAICSTAFEDPSSNAATIFLHRLTELLNSKQGMDFVVMGGFMHLLNACLDGSYTLHRSLLANGAISLVTHMMSRASSRIPSLPSEELRLAQDFLGHCTSFLLQSFDDSPTWLSVALRGHFIISIFKSLARSESSTSTELLEGTYASALDHIKPCLVYGCVLRETLRSIQTVKGRGLEPIFKGRGDLEDCWNELCHCVDSRNESRLKFRSLGLGACALRSECRHGNVKLAPTKSCSRCWSVVYCSRDCQVYSWGHGHREQCATILSRRRGGFPEPVSSRDHDFLWAVFYDEYQKRRDEIKEMRCSHMGTSRRKGIPRLSPNTPPVLLDFRGSPVEVSLDSLSEHAQMAKSDANVSAMYEKARSGMGELAIAIFPSGDPDFPEARPGIMLFTLIDPAMEFEQALEQKFLKRQAEFGAVRSVYF